MPVVQIYTMQSVAEALAVARLGVDRVGLTPAQRGLPGEITVDLAREIADAVRTEATVCALTVEGDVESIAAMVEAVRPDVLHLSGPTDALTLEEVGRLRTLFPGVEIMLAVAVTGPEAVADAQRFEAVVDSLILDSVTPSIDGIGAAGVVHDWTVSQAIVEAVAIPVILAGGLSPENIAEAIRVVRPWGVDSLTHTNQPLRTGGFRKDLDLVREFVAAAQEAGR
jgi:phosphoribosylanthranilate isomerase